MVPMNSNPPLRSRQAKDNSPSRVNRSSETVRSCRSTWASFNPSAMMSGPASIRRSKAVRAAKVDSHGTSVVVNCAERGMGAMTKPHNPNAGSRRRLRLASNRMDEDGDDRCEGEDHPPIGCELGRWDREEAHGPDENGRENTGAEQFHPIGALVRCS